MGRGGGMEAYRVFAGESVFRVVFVEEFDVAFKDEALAADLFKGVFLGLSSFG